MRRAQLVRVSAFIALAGLGWGTGCIHNHYYGQATPVCGEPAPAGTVASYGSVCEVPGAPIATGPGSHLVSATPEPSRVLVSEPRGEGLAVRSSARNGWRPLDHGGLATTSIEGAYNGDTQTR
jgi:hypothetical protein